MSALLERTIVTDETHVGQAKVLTDVIESMDLGTLHITSDRMTVDIPAELAHLIGHVVRAIAQGRSVTIQTMPEILTTTQAAQELGISRPTLMKMIHVGTIPAHKVGTHTRLRSADIVEARTRRLQEQRAALAELIALSDDLGEK